jgi:acetoin utilization deacetylase AcuC-like enzyme
MITAFYHPGYAAPVGEQHIMPMRKFALVAEEVSALAGIRIESPQPVSEGHLLLVHTPAYVKAIRTGEPRPLAESQKFPWSPQLFPSVLLTCGGCYAAAERALRDGVAAGLVSGFHHAHGDHGEGFCTFNGLVVAIDRLVAESRIGTAAVLDMDLHYGNGTASLAATRPYLFAVSIYGNDYQSNTAYRDVSVRRHEDGANHVSFALPAGSGRAEMMNALQEGFAHIVARKPALLLFQAGADPYREDPYSPLNLDHDDLLERDYAVFLFGKRHGIPIAWVLAGGYAKDVTKVVRAHVNTFAAARKAFADAS